MKKLLLALTALALLAAAVPAAALAETELPFLPELFRPAEVRLNMLEGENRATSYSGPGKNYMESGGYKPYKQQKVTIYFRENGWYLTDISYQTAEERFVYFRRSDLKSVPADFPEIDALDSWDGVTLGSVMPAWGPGSRFNRAAYFSVPDGTPVRAFFQENGFVYAEYTVEGKPTRMWLPADQVALDGATVTVTDETKKPFTISQFGRPTPQGPVSIPEDGSWSEWSDIPIEATENIEVETRQVYRRKIEIMDWSPWIDGDADDSDPDIETRMVTDEDGNVKWQWREYGYHYHYGEWLDWSEDPLSGIVSSSDIVESKIQYRARIVRRTTPRK